jgi:starch synthase (maltosyl-transferring)
MEQNEVDKDGSRHLIVQRVVIENVRPEIQGGRFLIKRVIGEHVEVTADIYADGHDILGAVVLHRPTSRQGWEEVPMQPLVNDRWQASFIVSAEGTHLYTLRAWVDPFQSWSRDFSKKLEAGQDISVDLLTGMQLIQSAAERASGDDAKRLAVHAGELSRLRKRNLNQAAQMFSNAELTALMISHADRSQAAIYGKELGVVVDRERARFSTWYELFPRSCGAEAERHGTFQDCERRLEYVSGMGFDVLYLPPIHPIGRAHRKGKNNTEEATAGDVGSPWAIGSREGGHKAIHPELGTLEDFRRLLARAKEFGLEVALDLAFQCAPDHPYVSEHKEWFRVRPDGTVQYAENPPKRYQDIYPLYFENDHNRELWEELRSVTLFWIEQGIRIFRVDNPHTKPFDFWEWLIASIKAKYPEVLFLSEAFTRPRVMYRLSQMGFTQSYGYFAWRNTKSELTEYFTELTQTEVREYFRANLWPNTPDILTEFLQSGGRPAFMIRLVLAATLGASYGVYGPAFELCENRTFRPGSEEYLDSEKYQVRHWDIDNPDSLRSLIASANRIRRDNPALQSDWSLSFHPVDNDQLIAYSKTTGDLSNIIVVIVNLDPYRGQSGWVDLPLESFHLDPRQPYQVEDLLTGAVYVWHGTHNYVALNPQTAPAHIFRIQQARVE